MNDSDKPRPTFAGDVQPYELAQVAERRRLVHGPRNETGEAKVKEGEWDLPRDEPLRADLVGLAFSGGGIRSATFNLGLLQALGRLKLLLRLDYLSTVSGGGYIGGWLAAWIRRANAEGRGSSAAAVQGRLDPRTNRQEAGQPAAAALPGGPLEPEPETIHHLRAHSRYLALRSGMFSLDTWALVAIYARNLLVTLLVVAPAVLCVALFCRWVIAAFAAWPAGDPVDYRGGNLAWGLLVTFAVLLLLADWAIRATFSRVFADAEKARQRGVRSADQDRQETAPPADQQRRQRTFAPWLWFVLTAGMLLVAVLGVWLLGPAPWSKLGPSGTCLGYRDVSRLHEEASRWPQALRAGQQGTEEQGFLGQVLGALLTVPAPLGDYIRGAFLFGVIALFAGVFGLAAGGRGLRRRAVFLGLTVFAGAAFGALFTAVINNVLFADGQNHPALFATIGPPLFLLAVAVAGFAETAVAGRWFDEYEREWRSRVTAWFLMCAAGCCWCSGLWSMCPGDCANWATGSSGRQARRWCPGGRWSAGP